MPPDLPRPVRWLLALLVGSVIVLTLAVYWDGLPDVIEANEFVEGVLR